MDRRHDRVGAGTVFNNHGLFTIACAQWISNSNTGTGIFNNYGVLAKTVAGVSQNLDTVQQPESSLPVPPTQVQVTAGELNLKREGVTTLRSSSEPGCFWPSTGGLPQRAGASADLPGSGTVTVSRGGDLQIADANTIINSWVTFNLLDDGLVAAGVLSGGNFISNGTFQWQGGQMNNLA